ncbi:diaminopropionate ammonia-lyase [Sphingomonas sp. UYAg733]
MASEWNLCATREGYSERERHVVSLDKAATALDEIKTWPGFVPTPLRSLPQIAAELGLAALLYKDESARLDQGSFKILGGAYAATLRLAHEDPAVLHTLCCATDGNHGRSVAYAARRHGCDCVVFMHEHASSQKAAIIESLGARVVRVAGTYDDSVRVAQQEAALKGWLLVSDTSADEFDLTTRRVMQGYGVMVLEILDQLENEEPPTHVFLQGGVGGLAAGVAGLLAEQFGQRRPAIVIVEPDSAACLLESARLGRPAKVGGDLLTAMEMLSTGEASPVAWPILQRRAELFVTIPDGAALKARDRLSTRDKGGPGLDVGVSGAAGFAGLCEIMEDQDLAKRLDLGRGSRVLVFGTEAAA